MHDRFYGLSADPFRLSPDHSFAYEHEGYTKARAYMSYAYLRAEGFVMVTGRPGTGKTTLVGALIDQLAAENVSTANLVCTQLQADDLLKIVANEFGMDTAGIDKGDLLPGLTRRLKAWHREGRRALLIVDEAQDLSVSAMEELRLLNNILVDGRPLLQIFLLGQPELRELILSPKLEQVHQRIVAACHLEPLRSENVEAYIQHRLKTVGWRGDPAISRAVYPLIYKFSEGIPRRINLICSRLLLHCAVEQRHKVCVSDVREVVTELHGESLAVGDLLTERDFAAVDVFDDPPSDEADGDAGAGDASDADIDPPSAAPVAKQSDEDNDDTYHVKAATARSAEVFADAELVAGKAFTASDGGRVVVLPQDQTARVRAQPARRRLVSRQVGHASAVEQWPLDATNVYAEPRAVEGQGSAEDQGAPASAGDAPPTAAGRTHDDCRNELEPSNHRVDHRGGKAEYKAHRDLDGLITFGLAIVAILVVVSAAGGFDSSLFSQIGFGR